MQVFHCDGCENLVFFENTTCMECSAQLGYLPEADEMVALPRDGHQLCANYSDANVCNWLTGEHELCLSCRLTRVIPDLSRREHEQRWFRIEQAKRRLVRQLIQFRLPIVTKAADPERGLAFELLADPDDPEARPVMTGHAAGVITINIAEADDAERERRRVMLQEPYRTLLGHVRHEIGHYYFDRLVLAGGFGAEFRDLFGDERTDYASALDRHYRDGPPGNWQALHVSPYAACHPHEDWTETWAHYFHITETIETARASGLNLRPRRADEPKLQPTSHSAPLAGAFDRVLAEWYPLTYVLNNLNRGMGMPDAYPFVLSANAVEKLRFVDRVIASQPWISARSR